MIVKRPNQWIAGKQSPRTGWTPVVSASVPQPQIPPSASCPTKPRAGGSAVLSGEDSVQLASAPRKKARGVGAPRGSWVPSFYPATGLPSTLISLHRDKVASSSCGPRQPGPLRPAAIVTSSFPQSTPRRDRPPCLCGVAQYPACCHPSRLCPLD